MIEDRVYKKNEVASFYKTNEEYGFLSNMKGKQEIHLNNILFTSSEAIYQSFKFPNNKSIQHKIACEKSPILAKRIATSNNKLIRSDWEYVKNNIMRLSIRIRAMQCPEFCEILLSTGQLIIVEISRKDTYWGTVIEDEVNLYGKNVLGRLLMELRDEIKNKEILRRIKYILDNTDSLIINDKVITIESLIADAKKTSSNNQMQLTTFLS